MFVVTPPGAAIGFVDVIVRDLTNPIIQATEIYGFYYLDDATAGGWIDAQVFPSPVGKLEAGELVVHLEITGSITSAFIVPQGGDPSVAAHRIGLTQESFQTHPNGSGNNLWVGTNSTAMIRNGRRWTHRSCSAALTSSWPAFNGGHG